MTATTGKNASLKLSDIGPALLCDLSLCGVQSIGDLEDEDPELLYDRLCARSGHRHDPSVRDVLAATIHEARTGEKTPWRDWTRLREGSGPAVF